MRAGNASEGHTILVQTIAEHGEGGPGSDVDGPAVTSVSTNYVPSNDAAAPTMNSAFASLGQSQPNLQLPPSALEPSSETVVPGATSHSTEPSDRNVIQQTARTLSKGGTPRSLHATDSGIPAVMEPDVTATVTPKTPRRCASVGASAAGPGPASSAAGPSTSATSAPKKKKASDMSKAERRALQEEQRAKKAAAKEVQGPLLIFI